MDTRRLLIWICFIILFIFLTLHRYIAGHFESTVSAEDFNRVVFTEESLHHSYLRSKSFADKYPNEYNMTRGKTCDQECARLRQVFSSWPADKPKAFIYILTSAFIKFGRTLKLRNILKQLDEYFLNHFKYPVVLFHEGEYDRGDAQTELRQHTSSLVIFQKVEFKLPQVHQYPVQFQGCCCFSMGYRHMCRFHAFVVYQMAIFQDVEYVWRLDDDSQLLSPITFDVFQFMRKNDVRYAYTLVDYEVPRCMLGLYQAVTFFKNRTRNRNDMFQTIPYPKIFYNNFEMSQVSLWSSTDYVHFIAFLDALSGIYSYRWGDAPIKTIAVQMFLTSRQIYMFNSSQIKYRHKAIQN